jgi:anti-sigma factor RsiW
LTSNLAAKEAVRQRQTKPVEQSSPESAALAEMKAAPAPEEASQLVEQWRRRRPQKWRWPEKRGQTIGLSRIGRMSSQFVDEQVAYLGTGGPSTIVSSVAND